MTIKTKTTRSLILLALIALVLAAAPPARAVTYTWNGAGFFGDQDFLWSNPFNWTPVGAPSPGETNVTLIFPNSAAPKNTTNDLVGFNVAAIEFFGSSYVVHGKPAGTTLGFGGGGGGNWAVLAAANGCSFAKDCPLALNSTGTIAVATGVALTVNSSISGVGGLTKVSPGTLKFAATTANTYAGTTTVGDGSLDLDNGVFSPSAIGYVAIPGRLVIGSADEIYAPQVQLLFDDQIADNAPITVNENGRLLLNGHDDMVGPVTLQGGLIDTDVVSGPSAPGTLTLNGNVTNHFGALYSNGEIFGHLSLGLFTRTFHVDSGSELRVGANISGSGVFNPGITKTGPGEMMFYHGSNTYGGLTLVQDGNLRLYQCVTPLGSTNSGTVVNSNAELTLAETHIGQESLTLNSASLSFEAGSSNSWAGPITLNGDCAVEGMQVNSPPEGLELSGVISGPGSLRKLGSGDLWLAGFGGNTFAGGLLAEQGATHLNKSASAPALASPLVIGRTNGLYPNDYGIVFVEQINQIPNNVPIAILPTGYLDGANGANDTLGNIEFFGGTLRGHTFTLSGNVTNHHSSFGGSIENDLELSAGTHVFHCDGPIYPYSPLLVAGALQGTGAITKAGPGILILAGANGYTGLTWVKEGELLLQGSGRPGSSAGGTIIENGADLYLETCSVTNETLTLRGKSSFFGGITVYSYGTNRWRGPVVLEADAIIDSGAYLALDGPISGVGGLTRVQYLGNVGVPTTLELTGSSGNTYLGDTIVKGGILQLNKSGATAIPGNLNINGHVFTYGTNVPVVTRLLQPDQIANSSAVTMTSPNRLELNGHAETFASLAGDGTVSLGSATLTLGGDGSSTAFSGFIVGSGGLLKTGGGTFTLSADNTYTGPTAVNAGTLLVFGQQAGSQVTVASGAKLGGTGRVGNLLVNNGATVSPGASPGVLSAGTVNLIGTTAALQIEINGTSPGSGYDQLKANGSFSFMGGALQLAMNIPGAVSNQYVIIDNDGADAIGGTFSGLPEGAMLTNNGAVFQITYHDGDGNDVALIQQSVGYVSEIISGAKLPNGRFAISALGAPGATYRVDATTNLTAPVTWTFIGTAVANGAGSISFSDVSAAQYPMRFYRLRFP